MLTLSPIARTLGDRSKRTADRSTLRSKRREALLLEAAMADVEVRWFTAAGEPAREFVATFPN
jgi:hypothetical protein